MICDKCGKNNAPDKASCKYCGADMPPVFSSSGFGDILTYKKQSVNEGIDCTGINASEGMDERDMQRLIKKSDKIIDSTRIITLFGIVAVGLSTLILITSLIIGIVTINKVNEYKDTTTQLIVETKKELAGYRKQLDGFMQEKEQVDEGVENKEEKPEENKLENNNGEIDKKAIENPAAKPEEKPAETPTQQLENNN